jgi:hypothetical protein
VTVKVNRTQQKETCIACDGDSEVDSELLFQQHYYLYVQTVDFLPRFQWLPQHSKTLQRIAKEHIYTLFNSAVNLSVPVLKKVYFLNW